MGKKSLLNRASMRVIACVAALSGVAVQQGYDALDDGAQNQEREYQLPANYRSHRAQQQKFLTSDGQIAFTDHGSAATDEGDVIVLLHGVPTSSWMYRKLIPLLQPQLRVISIDLLGFGSSDKPKTVPGIYSPDKQALRVSALMEHLKISQYKVLMHDMGSLVAWELLRQQAPIDDLVILNSIVHKQGFNHPDFDRGNFTKMVMMAYSNNLSSSMMLKRTFDELGLDTSNPLSEQECRGYVQPIEEGSNVALYEFFTGINDALFSRLDSNAAVFQQFKGNSLVLWGAQDSILTAEQISFLRTHLRIDESDVHVYADSNHFLAEEIPQEIAQRVLEFVQRN